MKEKSIEGLVIFSGEVEESHTINSSGIPIVDKSRQIKLTIKPKNGSNIEILCSKNSFLERGDYVNISYSTTPESINYGNRYSKLDIKNNKEILREGYLR